MKKVFLIFLLLVVNSKSVVYAQSNNDLCPQANNATCVKLNGLLSPCSGAISPPPKDALRFEYGVDDPDLARCVCNQEAYDTLSDCVSTCFSNGNKNIKAVDFIGYQKSCKKLGFSFGPPILEQSSSNDSADIAKKILIGIFSSISIVILGGLIFWYYYSKRAKAKRPVRKPSLDDVLPIPPETMTVHHPSPGSGTSVPLSSSSNGRLQPNPESGPPSHTGLFPPPGTVQQNYLPTPPSQPQYPGGGGGGSPYYNAPRYNTPSPPPPPPQQGYFPPQPPYPPFRPGALYPRPPPIRNPYQQQPYPHYNHGRPNTPDSDQAYPPRNTPPPPQNYYNANNYYGGH